MKKILILMAVLFASPVWSADAFVAKEDFTTIEGSKAPAKSTSVTVEEFFSYGCPWCFKLESKIGPWKDKLPKNVVFKRVPVIFESGWEWYAKAYYIGIATNQESKLTPKIFKAIHDDHEKLNSLEAMDKFLVDQGLDAEVVKSGLTHSVAIDTELMQSMKLMQAYKIYSVPAVIVAGHYRTDLQLAKGDPDRLMKIVEFLIQKSQSGSATH